MDIKQYFQDEMSFLHEQGKEFVGLYPKLASFLAEESSDPDVERLLEGFAFLTARLRQKVEDQFPEITHSVLNLLWPNYLRSIPSISMMKFTPLEDSITGRKIIEKGTEVCSEEVENTICEFRTTSELPVYPLLIAEVNDLHTRRTSTISLTLKTFEGLPLNQLELSDLEFYLGDEYSQSSSLYLWFFRYLKDIDIEIDGNFLKVPVDSLHPSGLDNDQGILPYQDNVFYGYRLLQEFFAFPEKFLFIKLLDLGEYFQDKICGEFVLHFKFERPLPKEIRVGFQTMQLFCCPAINLFSIGADPIKMDGTRNTYPITPKRNSPGHYEVFSVDCVEGWIMNEGGNMTADTGSEYHDFESFRHDIECVHDRRIIYYKVRIKESIRRAGTEHDIAFVYEDEKEALKASDVISLDLTCSNSTLPLDLNVGDLDKPTLKSPTFVGFTNITKPSPPIPPILDGSLFWRLISNLSLNYVSLLDKDALITILSTYDFPSHQDRLSEQTSKRRYQGIKSLTTEPTDVLFKGLPIRGLITHIEMDENYFLSEGDMYLFSTVLAEFFSQYSSINSFHILNVTNIKNKESYQWQWDAKKGQQPLI